MVHYMGTPVEQFWDTCPRQTRIMQDVDLHSRLAQEMHEKVTLRNQFVPMQDMPLLFLREGHVSLQLPMINSSIFSAIQQARKRH